MQGKDIKYSIEITLFLRKQGWYIFFRKNKDVYLAEEIILFTSLGEKALVHGMNQIILVNTNLPLPTLILILCFDF